METKHSTFINKIKIMSLLALLSILAACGGGDSSSENSEDETTVVTNDGAVLTVDQDEITAGEVITVTYNLGGDDVTGTIRWGDNTDSVIRGSGEIRHRYGVEGTRSVSVQVDGADSSVRVFTINVTASQIIDADTSSTTADSTSSTPTPTSLVTATVGCTSVITSVLVTQPGGVLYEYKVEPYVGFTRYIVTNVTTGTSAQDAGPVCGGVVIAQDGYFFTFGAGNPSSVTVTP